MRQRFFTVGATAISIGMSVAHVAWSRDVKTVRGQRHEARQDRGRRMLRTNEFDLYGPRPFPEQISHMVDDMVAQILRRQEPNGSWIDHTYKLDGSMHKNHLAGGTVKIITNTSLMCLVLRKHEETNRAAIDEAIRKGVLYVLRCVNQGRLSQNVGDAPWRLAYALRFLAREYPHVEDARLRSAMRGASEVLIKGLRGSQQLTWAEKTSVVSMRKPGDFGIRLDHEEPHESIVAHCPEASAAHRGGMRVGDVLISVNGTQLGSPLNYDFMRFDWIASEPLTCKVRRDGNEITLTVTPQATYPGTIGLQVADVAGGVVVRELEFLSDAPRAGIQVGDVITKIDDTPIQAEAGLKGLTLLAGQSVKVEGVRDGKPFRAQWLCAPVPFSGMDTTFAKVDKSSAPGTRIDGFLRGSCLAAAGLKKGDRVLSIDGISVLGVDQFEQLRRTIPGGKRVEVVYVDANGQQVTTMVTTSTLPNTWGYKPYHGIQFDKRSAKAVIGSVAVGSPAALTGELVPRATIVEINGESIPNKARAQKLLGSTAAGTTVRVSVQTNGVRKDVQFVTRRVSDSIWNADSKQMSGGWSYLKFSRTTTFMTADILVTLLDARQNMGLQIPESMMYRAYMGLLNARRTYHNSTAPNFLYDGSGCNNYSWVKDARQHFSRGAACELACLRYDEYKRRNGRELRTRKDLEGSLKEWLVHRWNLDRVRFPSGHDKKMFSIAPYYLPYSYYTAMEAANYLKGNDALVEEIKRFGLALLASEYVVKMKPGVWFVAGLQSEIPLQYYNMLMLAGELKSYYEPRMAAAIPELQPVVDAFNTSRYGEAYRRIQAMDDADRGRPDVKRIEAAIAERYETRLVELETVHREYPHDALRYLEKTQPHFEGSPSGDALQKLAAEWRQTLPALPKWFALGACPWAQPGEDASAAWGRIFAPKDQPPPPSAWPGATDLMATADAAKDALKGKWIQADGQLVSPYEPYARLQLPAVPKGSYRFETQFTRIGGDCIGVVFPVGKTSALLVVSGWAGKVSGIAFIDGKDADRNATTRDGSISNNRKHTLQLDMRLLDTQRARIAIRLDGKPYLDWEGKRSSLTPDRAWRLRRPGSLGIGAYNARVVFHGCQWEALQDRPTRSP
jgi:S1-C subfamily serine protease